MNIKQYASCLLLLATLNSFAAHFYNATTKPIQVSGGKESPWATLASNTSHYYKPRMRWAFPDRTSGYYFGIKFEHARDDAKLLEVEVRHKELKEFQEPTFVITEDPSTPSGLYAELTEGKPKSKAEHRGAPGGPAFPPQEEEKKVAAATPETEYDIYD